MTPPPTTPPTTEESPPGPGASCLVVNIGLSCPSCRTQLTLPSAFLGEVVTGPCPMCGTTLVFCHGRIENALATGAAKPAIDPPVLDRNGTNSRKKLPRSGTVDVAYLEESDIHVAREEASWDARPSIAGRSASSRAGLSAAALRRWWWVLGVGGVLMLAVAAWWVAHPASVPPAPQLAEPGIATSGPRAEAGQSGQGAAAAWQAFVRATSVEEKLAHVLDAKRVAPEMRAFYDVHPEMEADWADREFRPLAGTSDDRRRGLQALGSSPRSAGEPPVILFFRTVRSDPAGGAPTFLLDWETYVQERERLAEAFIGDPGASRRTLRLAVERVHVFGSAASPTSSNRQDPIGLKLRTPSGLLLGRVAEVRADTALWTRLDDQLRWGVPAYATVQLSWDTAGAEPRLFVTDLVCWHFPGLGGTPEFETELSPLSGVPSRKR